ncbi:RES family NAD+ phosphorylase [Microvirga sp. TS319]|uniref:RES family NAD+ phosphorylase n=1 Tax=Microvirga sp. TS319 TaxID=3241165 RepID=UPI00351A3D73
MPDIIPEASRVFVSVNGTFYRAIVADGSADSLRGSIAAGRYSKPGQRTLYMSATEEGVAAAMQAHPLPAGTRRTVCAMAVEAHSIFDLRDDRACEQMGIRRGDALAPWQELVANGGVPTSWGVRAHLERAGAHGLIDPSRTASGLWHLVLFRWNMPGAPTVKIVPR